MRHPLPGTALAAVVILLGARLSSAAAQVPYIPATFYGAATLDGQAPPAGTAVRGLIDGVDCTQPGDMGTIDAGEVGAYVVHVMHESQKPGCGSDGKQVVFTIDGRQAGQSASWKVGIIRLDLNAGSGEPKPLPSAVAIPLAEASTTPSVPPTDDVQLPGTARNTPLAPGVSPRAEDNGSSTNVAGIVVAALVGFGIVGAVAGWALSRRRTPEGPGSPPSEGGH